MSGQVMPADAWQSEVDQLRADEQIIEAGLATFVEVGQALARIRDGRRYRLENFDTFEDYCRERWGFARSTAYQLMEGAEAVSAIADITSVQIANEGQAREVAAIIKAEGPERAAEILNEVADAGPVTAKAIREAARPADTRTDPLLRTSTTQPKPAQPADEVITGDIVEPVREVDEHPFVANDTDYRLAVIRRDVVRHIKHMSPPVDIDPADAARAITGDESTLAILRRARASIDDWCDQIETQLAGGRRLRVVGDN